MFLGLKTHGFDITRRNLYKRGAYVSFFIAFKKFWFVQIPVIGKGFVVIGLKVGIYYNPEQVVIWFHELM